MPYTLKTQQISVKDPDSGEYIGVDVLTEQTKESLITELQAEGDTQIERINQAAVDVQSAVDQAETEAQQLISSTQSSLNTLETQKDTIAQTIASMAELGTDTTLTTAGMAADAKKTGDEISNVKNDISELYTTVNLLDLTHFVSNTNQAVVNNEDGTFTFGTSSYGTTCFESIGEVPAGTYELFGLPLSNTGWVYVSTQPSYNTGVIINNATQQSVSYTNPTDQKLYILVYIKAKPSASFTISPSIMYDKQSVLDLFADDISSIDSKIEELNEDASNTFVDIETEYIPITTNHSQMVINVDGSITDGTVEQQNVLEIHIDDAVKFRLKADSYGNSSGAIYAFYDSESFSNCDSTTLIGSIRQYNRVQSIFDYDIPKGAKTLLIYYRTLGYISCVNVKKELKGYISIAPEYNETKSYKIGDFVNHNGITYRCICNTESGEQWTESHWVSITVTEKLKELTAKIEDFSKRSIFVVGTINASSGEIESSGSTARTSVSTQTLIPINKNTVCNLAEGYRCNVYYYNEDGTYTGIIHNLSDVSLYRNIILAGSYVKFSIKRIGNTTELIDLDISEYVDKITYNSDYLDLTDQIESTKQNASNGWTARMYQKGAAPKSFSNEKPICILCAGQSNMAGVIPNEDIPSDIVFPLSHVMYSPSNKPSVFDNGITNIGHWGVDLSLYKALNDLGNTVYAIKYAVGGTGIDTDSISASDMKWTAFYEKLSGIEKSLLYTLETKIRSLGSANQNVYDIRALIWHQGENDSMHNNSGNPYVPARYYENFKYVIAYLRGVVGNERLPVIYGTISHSSLGYDPVVEEAQLRIAQEDPNCYCIDMSGATLKDEYHFDPASAVYFGYKAYDALIDFGVVSGTKINPTRPW